MLPLALDVGLLRQQRRLLVQAVAVVAVPVVGVISTLQREGKRSTVSGQTEGERRIETEKLQERERRRRRSRDRERRIKRQ